MLRPIEWGWQPGLALGARAPRLLTGPDSSASDAGRDASYFASDGRSLVECTKFASSYATTSESRYLTVRPSRTKRMYEPVTRALRTIERQGDLIEAYLIERAIAALKREESGG